MRVSLEDVWGRAKPTRRKRLADGPLSRIHAFRAIRTSMCSTDSGWSEAQTRFQRFPGRPISVPDQIGIPYVPVGRVRLLGWLTSSDTGCSPPAEDQRRPKGNPTWRSQCDTSSSPIRPQTVDLLPSSVLHPRAECEGKRSTPIRTLGFPPYIAIVTPDDSMDCC
jgi:hypothetical protein